MKKRISLQRSITLSVLLIGLLSGAIGLGYAYLHEKHTRRATVGLYFQELARQSADKVGLMLTKEIEWVERLSALPEVRESVKQGARLAFTQPGLQRWRDEQRQYFRSLTIVDRRGMLVGGVTSDTTRAHYAQQPWWPIVFGQARPWAGELRVDEKGRSYWEVAVPIMDDGETAVGALKVVIGADELFASVLRTRIGQTGHVMLLDEQGRVLACPVLPAGVHTRTDAFVGGGIGAPPGHPGAAWAEVQDDSHGVQGSLVGISFVGLPARIAQERAWRILVRQDPKETDEPARTLLWRLAWFWLGAIGLIALLGAMLARRIVQPLEALVDRVRRLADGRPVERLEAPGKTSQVQIAEIDTLASSFDSLVDRLDAASRETRRNVSELERANQSLATSEEHYRTLWDHAVDAKLIVDAAGTIQAVNRRAELRLGLRTEEMVGTVASDLVLPEDRPAFRQLLRTVLETGKEGVTVEIRVPTSAGSMFTMEADAVPIERQGNDQAILLQLSDITEKKQLEQQLLRSERLASLSQFASMFVHDIRNPLAGIKKTLELLGSRCEGCEVQPPPIVQLLGDLHFTTDLLLGMINDMLDVYQESYSGLPLVSTQFSVGPLLQEVAHLFKPEADAKGVTIQLALPEDVMITADRRRLQRVGINLVHNALKFSPSQSAVTFSAERKLEGQPDAPWHLGGGPVLLIRVEDEGPGLAPNDLPHLFEMFFRKKDGHDLRIGRGLGLHFCRLVVEAHGGRIWADNRASGGAVFSVALPLNGDDACRSSL